ncbi:MAG: flagellar biosynthetic protein FliR [Acidobacteriota bacterium]
MTLGLPISTMLAFLLVLTRVGAFVAFLPGPVLRAAPNAAQVVLAMAITFALFPFWPNLPNEVPSIGRLLSWAFGEAGFGLAVGLAVSFLMEGFQVAMQLIGLQAGYGYSQTMDPTSQSDSGVLQVIVSLAATLLFFVMGFDRQLIRILAVNLQRFPAGSWTPSAASLDGVVRLGSGMLSFGLRLALPVIGLLLLLDLALALLGRMQQQLQLLSLAFPAKMLATLLILAALSPVMPRIFAAAAERTMNMLWGLLA